MIDAATTLSKIWDAAPQFVKRELRKMGLTRAVRSKLIEAVLWYYVVAAIACLLFRHLPWLGFLVLVVAGVCPPASTFAKHFEFSICHVLRSFLSCFRYSFVPML